MINMASDEIYTDFTRLRYFSNGGRLTHPVNPVRQNGSSCVAARMRCFQRFFDGYLSSATPPAGPWMLATSLVFGFFL
ncbi:hypothetical protein EXN66_Car014071 [Channa argus]|uniref:Uncharacterized protein n=1 Tax=Channa argus TaxID=215402 RepID=A0A6G1Q6X4_CHAAH|nr:hypothetical protein EXN66_Car014071 [Channa argus]